MPMQANAQSLNAQVQEAFNAVGAGDFEKAHAAFSAIVNEHGAKGKEIAGGKFGELYFKKGLCEWKLAGQARMNKDMDRAKKYWEMCSKSFADCQKFPSDAKGRNEDYFKSMRYQGQAYQMLNKPKEAIESYKKFIKEREPKDSFDPGMFNINMAICHYKLKQPELKIGSEFFETALKNREKQPISDGAAVTAFKALADACIKEKNEQALKDFIKSNRSAITLDPHKMYQFTPFFMRLGSQAFKKGQVSTAYSLFSLMPGTFETKDDILAEKTKLVGYTRPVIKHTYVPPTQAVTLKQLDVDLDDLKYNEKQGKQHELIALQSLAHTFEETGYYRGAFAAYRQLEEYFPKAATRELNLYNLVRLSSVIQEVSLTEEYGSRFLKSYPQSKYAEPVRKLMLISLFYTGNYEEALEVATNQLPQLEENTKQHDVCLHVLGGSLFYTGKFFEAQDHLKKHVETYPKSDYKMASRYFEASNASRLQQSQQAAAKLDRFLKDFPNTSENPYYPTALYDRASTHLALEEYEQAHAALDRIEKEFPGCSVEALSYLLQGDIFRTEGEFDKAKVYYDRALELAKRRDQRVVVGESLYKLVAMLGQDKMGSDENPRILEAVPYYDDFWKNYQDTPYKSEVAMAGISALMKSKRVDEALTNAQIVISEKANQEKPRQLEESINTYGKYYLASGKSAEDLRKHFENFPGVDASNMKAQALLRVAVIGIFEEQKDEALNKKNESLAAEYEAKIGALFRSLQNSYQPEQLSDYTLIRLGTFVSEKTHQPKMALPYYEKIIERGGQRYRSLAVYGKARILAYSGDKAMQTQALKIIEKEILPSNTIDRATKDKAAYDLVKIYESTGQWQKVLESARKYNDERYSSKKLEVAFLLAKAYDNLGQVQDAISTYSGIYQRYKSTWAVSVESLIRASQLIWEHGKPVKGKSNQQIAYEMAANFYYPGLKVLEQHGAKMSNKEKADFKKLEALVLGWESTGSIKTIEQIKKEHKQGE